MTTRHPAGRLVAVLIWALLGMTLVGVAAATVVAASGAGIDPRAGTEHLAYVAYGIAGVLIVRHRPRNAIGWMLLLVGALRGVDAAASAYALRWVDLPGVTPGGIWAAWVVHWIWSPAFVLQFVLLPFLFPDGSPPRGRWRWLLWLSVAMFVQTPALWIQPGSLDVGRADVVVPNPLGVPAAEWVTTALIEGVSLVFLAVLASVVVAMVRRYRSSGVEERLQLTWFVAAIVLLAVSLLLSIHDRLLDVSLVVNTAAGVLVPVAVVMAVLRYRLYEIDRIVSRTVTYSVLTVVVVGVYAGAVLAAQVVLGPADAPDLVVAAATLLAAAVVRPLRSRIQQLVDRRFNRAPYDAERVVAAFGARLRDEVDLGALTGDLRVTVAATVVPRSVSLWMREVES
jgi:hypothetical protein